MNAVEEARSWIVMRVCAIGVITVLLYGAKQLLDLNGWWIHRNDSNVYLSGEWMIGEYRECTMGHKSTPDLQLDCQKRDEAETWNQLFEGVPAHLFSVRFHGRTERSDTTLFQWRCQRNESSITCWALN